jgi:hypothetical protein
VIGSLADVSAYYTYDLLGLEGGDGKPLFRNELAVAALAVAIIAPHKLLHLSHHPVLIVPAERAG